MITLQCGPSMQQLSGQQRGSERNISIDATSLPRGWPLSLPQIEMRKTSRRQRQQRIQQGIEAQRREWLGSMVQSFVPNEASSLQWHGSMAQLRGLEQREQQAEMGGAVEAERGAQRGERRGAVRGGMKVESAVGRERRQVRRGGGRGNLSGSRGEDVKRETHRMLKVMSGSKKGLRLLSPADQNVRPMMEVVRGAVFNILQAMSGGGGLPPQSRWLDLYSGTGSVGIEALSRGCCQAHFVEMDPWVVSSVLSPNLDSCSFSSSAVIHMTRAETFLERAELNGAAAVGGSFDFVSVTPPYEAVVYRDLMNTLSRSPLLSETSCMIVEYPQQSAQDMPDSCGPLARLKDRKYGRTFVAVYGPQWFLEDNA